MAGPRFQLDSKPLYALPLSIGNVLTAISGASAAAGIRTEGTGQFLDLTLPQGPSGADVAVRFDAAQSLTPAQKTQACANAGAWADAQAGRLLGVPGYQILPSGLILQWGVRTGSPDGLYGTYFPVAFPNKTLAVIATPSSTNTNVGFMMDVYSIDKTGFSALIKFAANGGTVANAPGVDMHWLALGY